MLELATLILAILYLIIGTKGLGIALAITAITTIVTTLATVIIKSIKKRRNQK